MLIRCLSHLFLALCCLFAASAWAQNDQSGDNPHVAEVKRTYQAAIQAAQAGPRSVSLGSQAVLNLPAGFVYVPVAEASAWMRAMGNIVDGNFQGLVLSEQMNGFVSIDFDPAGYIKDGEAKDWNPDELLQGLKEGTEAGNAERRKQGQREFEVVGWVEKPAYDAGTHRLVWSAAIQDKGVAAASVADQGVNYNTYLLGREGYMSLNLVTDRQSVEAEKPLAKTLLAAVSFNSGKRYQDFNASTDKVAEYGLAALVGGIAAKKLGLLATLGVFFVKAWKLILIGMAGLGATARKFFGGKKEE